jgi:phosphatidylinositol alpha-1,6-mannosyltransferase
LHGNDFLKPWLACGPAWLEALRRPHLSRLRHRLRRGALRRNAGALTHAFTNSRNTRNLACAQLGLAQERISVVPPAVDDAFFSAPLAPLRGSGDPLRLLTVTRLTRYSARKNVDGVLRALASLPREVRVHYTVVGEGDDRPRLESLAAELGLAGRVRFAGRLESDGLLAAYAASDAFILAARANPEDVEGFGIVYIESSALGRPVICSREGGATDAVEEGVNGIVLPSSSTEDIAAGIRRLADSPALFSPERVRAWAGRFRWESTAREIRDRIRSSIAEQAAGARR